MHGSGHADVLVVLQMPGALHLQPPAIVYQVIDIAHLGYFNAMNDYNRGTLPQFDNQPNRFNPGTSLRGPDFLD